MNEIKTFVENTKTELDKLVCADINDQVTELGKAKDGETADKKRFGKINLWRSRK